MTFDLDVYLESQATDQARRLSNYYDSPVFVDERKAEKDWLRERYGYGIYDAIAWAATVEDNPDLAVGRATGGEDLYTPDPTLAAAVNWAKVEEERGVSLLENIADVGKGVTRTAVSIADAPWEVAANLTTQQFKGINDWWQDKGDLGKLFDAAVPEEAFLPDTYRNTTIGQQVELAATEGFDMGFGEAGAGDGFFIEQDTAVGRAKEERALEQWTLPNGQAATPGRAIASAVGQTPDTTGYDTISGAFDMFVALALDPLNFAGGAGAAIKAGKLGQTAAKAANKISPGVSPGEAAHAVGKIAPTFGDAATGAKRMPGAANALQEGGELADSFKVADAARSKIFEVAESDPDMANLLRSLGDRVVAGLDTSADEAVRAANESDAGAAASWIRQIIDETNAYADQVYEGTIQTTDELGYIAEEIRQVDARLEAARARKATDTGEEVIDITDDAVARGDVGKQQSVDDLQVKRDELDEQFEARRLEELKENARLIAEDLVAMEGEAQDAMVRYAVANAELTQTLTTRLGAARNLDPSEPFTYMKALNGITEESVDMNKAYRAMSKGGTIGEAPEILAKIDDPWVIDALFGGKLTPEALAAISASRNPSEITVHMMSSAHSHARFNARKARQFVNLGGQGPAAQEIMMTGWTRRMRNKVANAARQVNTTDPEASLTHVKDSLNQVYDLGTARKGSTKTRVGMELYQKYVNDIVRAPTASARKSVIQEMHIEMIRRSVEFLPGYKPGVRTDVYSDFYKQISELVDYARKDDVMFADRLSRIRANMQFGKNAIAEKEIEALTKDSRFMTFLSHASYDVTPPDYNKLNKIMRSMFKVEGDRVVAKSGVKGGKRKVDEATLFYDTYLRPLLLVGRPAYVGLQFADASMRSFTYGFSSAFNHPIHSARVAMAAADGQSKSARALRKLSEKWYDKFQKSPKGINNENLFNAAEREVETLLTKSGYSDLAALHQQKYLHNLTDPRDSIKIVQAGWKELDPEDVKFVQAWGDEAISTFATDGWPIRRKVYDVMAAGRGKTDNYPQWLLDYAERPIESYDDAKRLATEYFKVGPGRKDIDELWGMNIKNDNADSAAVLRAYENNLEAFLFDEADGGSVAFDTVRMTGDFNDDVIRLIADSRQEFLKTADDAAFHRSDLRKMWRQATKNVPMDRRPTKAFERIEMSLKEDKTAGKALKNLMGGFFEEAAWVGERGIAHAPMLADAYVEEVVKRIPLMSPREARRTAKFLRTHYNTKLKVKGLPDIGQSKRVRKAFRDLDIAVHQANGTGVFSIDDVDMAAKAAAAQQMNELFYGLKGRNMLSKRLVLLVPFAQAFVNPLRVYAKALKEDPRKIIQMTRAYQTAQTEESGVIYDYFGIRPGPNTGILYWDDFGTQKVRVPFLGYLWGALPFVHDQPSYMEFSAAKMNPINFGEATPGLGPVPQAAFAASQQVDAVAAKTPEEVKDFISPYRQYGVSFLPGWMDAGMQQAMETLGMIDQSKYKEQLLGPMMAALYAKNPEKYSDENGYITAQGESLLAQDASSAAGMAALGDQAKRATFRGVSEWDKEVTKADGSVVLLSQLKQDYWDRVQELGDTGMAAKQILDEYGEHNVFHLVGRSDYMTVGTEHLYKWVRENSEGAEAFGDVIGYIDPNLNLAKTSNDMRQWQQEHGQGSLRDPEEVVRKVNELLYKVKRANLELAKRQGLDEDAYEAARDRLSAETDGVSRQMRDPNWSKNQISQLQAAVDYNDGELTRTYPAAWAIQKYLKAREYARSIMDGKSLGNKGNAHLRAELMNYGNDLRESVLSRTNEDSFGEVWDGLLKQELVQYE